MPALRQSIFQYITNVIIHCSNMQGPRTFFNISRPLISCSINLVNQSEEAQKYSKNSAKSLELIFLCMFSNKYDFSTSLGSNSVCIGSKFGIFGGFRWIRSSILADVPGFGRVHSSVFTDLVLGSAISG